LTRTIERHINNEYHYDAVRKIEDYIKEITDGMKMRRSRMDIVVEILDVAKNGVNKTAIVYRTNLNFKLADKYLILLGKQGLLENNSEKYITTEKGNIFLGKAKELTLQLETPIQKTKEIRMNKSKETNPWLEVSVRKSKDRILDLEVPNPAL